jgi:hypothetical protein
MNFVLQRVNAFNTNVHEFIDSVRIKCFLLVFKILLHLIPARLTIISNTVQSILVFRFSRIRWLFYYLYLNTWEPGYLSLDDQMIEVRSPGEAKGFFLQPLYPDRLWGPHRLLSNGSRSSSPGNKGRPVRDADHSPHLMPRSRMSTSYTSTPPLFGVLWDFFTYVCINTCYSRRQPGARIAVPSHTLNLSTN